VAPYLIDLATDEQKERWLPAFVRGELITAIAMSEPGAGSDLQGLQTSARRDGDEWVLNGSKVWTTGAWWSDWGLLLARTNWDVPKHRGLTVFIMPLHQEGVEVQRIAMLNGFKDFCQEFMSDVRVPDTDRVGNVDDGWTVGTRWMFHERMLYNSPYVTLPVGGRTSGGISAGLVRSIAVERGNDEDPVVADLVGEARTIETVKAALQQRLNEGLTTGRMNDQSAAIGRIYAAGANERLTAIAYEVAGTDGVAWTQDDGPIVEIGHDFLLRQASSIGGGTTEVARNVVAERVLGMPRERSGDKDIAFRDVPRGPS
jgi:alkylation response protein AidB-like acyl-CoA dehydrogenase